MNFLVDIGSGSLSVEKGTSLSWDGFRNKAFLLVVQAEGPVSLQRVKHD